MAWVRIDDSFADHPKVALVGPLGMVMQIQALCYANRYLTDGKLPSRIVAGFMPTVQFDPETGASVTWRDIAKRLVDVGMWLEIEGGYQIHDYHDYQPSKADVEALREKRREAGRKGGKAKGKQSAKQDAKQNATNYENKSFSTIQAQFNPVPDPLIDDDDTRARTREAWTNIEHWFGQAFGGTMNGSHYQEIDEWTSRGLSLEAVAEALRRAALQKARSWDYVRKICKRWIAQGLLTLEQVREDDERWEAERNRRSKGSSQARASPQRDNLSWIDAELAKLDQAAGGDT